MRTAVESLGAGADVTVGLELPDGDFNRLILRYTIRRWLLVQSFFTQPGGCRHDPVEHATKLAQTDADCEEVSEGL